MVKRKLQKKSLSQKPIDDISRELKEGNERDKIIAFKCIGILSNESTSETLEKKLEIVNKMLEKHEKIK